MEIYTSFIENKLIHMNASNLYLEEKSSKVSTNTCLRNLDLLADSRLDCFRFCLFNSLSSCLKECQNLKLITYFSKKAVHKFSTQIKSGKRKIKLMNSIKVIPGYD